MALKFGQVADILLHANNIPEERRETRVSRIKQWQKMGFPDGVNVGKRAKVHYGATQVYQLAIHMRLLSLGLTPERAQDIIRSAWQSLADAIVKTALRRAMGDSEYCYLIIQYDALTDLREPDATHNHIYVSATPDQLIVDAFQGIDDLPEEERSGFEQFQYMLRNSLVNAIVLEIDSIVFRIWAAMVKLGISPTELGDMKAWMVEMIEREKGNDKVPVPEFTFSDNLAGANLCPACFATEILDLPTHSHQGG